MNRRSKRRLIVVASIVGIIVAAGVGGTALRKINRERIAKNSLAEGMAAYEQQDYPAALRSLRIYARYNTQDPDVWLALGDAQRYVEEPNARHLLNARGMLEQAVLLDPENVRPREILLDIHLQLGQWQELAQVASGLLELQPDNLYAARLRIEANLNRGAEAQAIEAAREMVKAQNGSIEAHLEMVSTMSRAGRPARELREYIENVIAPEHDGATGLQVIRAGVEFDYGQRDRAIGLLMEAGSTTPTDGVGARLLLDAVEQIAAATGNTALYQTSQDEWLISWLEDENLAPHLYEVAAGRAWREGDAQRAIDLANRAIGGPKLTEAAFAWGWLAALELSRATDAERFEGAFDAAIVKHAQARAENWRAAIKAFDRLSKGQPPASATPTTAALATNSPRGSDGVAAYVDAVRDAERNNTPDAIVRLRVLGEQPSWRRARLSQARVLMGANRPEEAYSVLVRDERLMNSIAGQALLGDALASIAERTGNTGVLDLATLEAELEDHPESPVLLAAAGRTALVQGESTRALEFGQRLSRAEAARAAVASVRFAERLYEVDTALAEAIIDRVAQTGEQPLEIAAAATGMAALGRPDEARALIEQRSQGATGPTAQAWNFARIQLANTIDDQQSLQDLARLSEAGASDPRIQMEILSGSAVWNDEALTSQIIGRLRDAQGDAASDWRVFEARRLLADSDNAEAARNAAALFEPIFRSETGRRSTRNMLLAADAFARLNNTESELQALGYAADGDNPLAALPRLIDRLQATGNSERAAQRLRQFVEMGNVPTGTRIVRHQLLERQGMRDLALRDIAALAEAGEPAYVLRNAVITRPMGSRTPLTEAERAALDADLSPQGQVYAAQLLARVGRYEDGLARLESFPEMSELGSRTLVIARYMGDHGHLDDALTLLVEHAKANDDPDAWMEAATLLVGANRVPEAIDLLDDAVAAMPDNQAIANFSASLRGDMGVDTFDRMARFTVSSGERAEATDGLKELAAICQRYLDKEITAALAASELEAVSRNRATLYPVWPLLIAAYEQQGDPAKAVQAARAAVDALPGDYRVVRDATQLLMKLGQYQEALGLAGTWLSLAPDPQSRAQAEIALGYCEYIRGNAQRAISLLEPRLDMLMADSATNGPAIRAVAEALVTTNRMERAEEILKDLAQSDTQWAAFMASIAASAPSSQANIERAVRWLELVTPQLTNDTQGAAYLASAWMALRELTGENEYAARAISVAQTAIQNGVDSWELQTALATAQHAQGNYRQAVEAYERALELVGVRIPGLLNNAAWLYTAELGEHAKAVAMAQEAVDSAQAAGNPRDQRAIFHHTLGVAQLASGNASAALTTFEAGLQLAETPSLHLGRVEALLAANRRTEASAEFGRLRPTDQWTEANHARYRDLQKVLGSG